MKAFARLTGQVEDRAHLLGYVQRFNTRYFSLSGYCPAIAHAVRLRFMLRSSDFTPLPGDGVLFDFGHSGEPHHIGFVRAVCADGLIQTVEGNTKSGDEGDQADGDGVFLRTRSRGSVFGFVHFQ